MTPEAFISKWTESTTTERASSQSHFIDLCKLLDEPTPQDADPHGEWYAFEKGVEKTGAGHGWADVWKRGCFGWEYKRKSGGRASTMSGALAQLQLYALALESPPLLIVSDIDTIEIHTAFQNAVQEVHYITLADIADHKKRQLLKWAFDEPERLRPTRTRDQITKEAAGQFAQLAYELRGEGHDPLVVAHFLNKILFCMFAEDAGILRSGLFTEVAEQGVEHPEHFDIVLAGLFQAMQKGGPFGVEIIDWFNGGLFDNDGTLPLTLSQLLTIRDLARMDWSQIEPAVFGTLFERGLDPAKRSQLGAHYTDPESIMRLVNPTIVEPLLAEWQAIKPKIAHHMERLEKVKTKQATEKRRRSAQELLNTFLEKLKNFRVLDPACGSGNFLYLSLHALKNIEHRINIEAEALGLQRQLPQVGPEAVLGIEKNTYAAELARVTIWIGEIQWMLSHGYAYSKDPILKPLNTIEERDALINSDGSVANWPDANVIIGNPPFIGNKKMIAELGEEYVTKVRGAFKDRVPGGADFVTFWFEKSRDQIENNNTQFAGLVSTNSIRGGKNRDVLKRIIETGKIFNAWSDEPWINEGAAVRVSLLAFTDKISKVSFFLNGTPADKIYSDLTSGSNQAVDITEAKKIKSNVGVAFQGSIKAGDFDVSGELARTWLQLPSNPNGRRNNDVLFPWVNGADVTRRNRGKWIVNFGFNTIKENAALYEAPFTHVEKHVLPKRKEFRDERARNHWWIHHRPRPKLFAACASLSRYIITPRVSKYRVFCWMPKIVVPDSATIAFAREDDVTFGILHSRLHEVWSLRQGTHLGKGNDPRYTPTSTFETFPFPEGLTPDLEPGKYCNQHSDAIANAAKKLNELRENWLNPVEWITKEVEVFPGYPDRILPANENAAKELESRTLTHLYNLRPTWLDDAHRKLDETVSAAYGWDADLSDDEILKNLLELNLQRAT